MKRNPTKMGEVLAGRGVGGGGRGPGGERIGQAGRRLAAVALICTAGWSAAACAPAGTAPNNAPPPATDNTVTGAARNLPATSKWMTFDASAKTVNLRLEAGINDGFNFNGYANGKMTVTVPLGWKVNVKFVNDSAMPHSAMIVPFNQVKGSRYTPAFPGAFTPNPDTGVGKGVAQTFAFTADKAGQYGIVCAVPGHDEAGMWDILVVTGNANRPSIATAP
ncbi:MAG: hypothetical protein K6T30_03315 [Alicyclobacillus sp.]|nr:hypothetical protein [Alicyclobacillus sp.]